MSGAQHSPEIAQVMDILAAHGARAQNVEGDWICACGSSLCPPNDDRLDLCHREHVATILTRRVFVAEQRNSPAEEADRG